MIPTVEEVLEADAVLYRKAIEDSLDAHFRFGQGMDAKELTGHAMRYLRGKGNPAAVYRLALEYLENGLKFKEFK